MTDDTKPSGWLQRYIYDPELGASLGHEYVELLERVSLTWGDLLFGGTRSALAAVFATAVMGFWLPRGGWWLLVGGLAPLLVIAISVVISAVTGRIRVSLASRSITEPDGNNEIRLEEGAVVMAYQDEDESRPFMVHADGVAAALGIAVAYVFPGLIYCALLILGGGYFGAGYGQHVETPLVFIAVGVPLAFVTSAVITFLWATIQLLPALIGRYR